VPHREEQMDRVSDALAGVTVLPAHISSDTIGILVSYENSKLVCRPISSSEYYKENKDATQGQEDRI
jgi:hypothetical protein